MLMTDSWRGLVVLRMLLQMRRMVILRLELGDLHAESLVGVGTIHHDMLPLVGGLVVHCERIEGRCLMKWWRAGRRRCVVGEL